MAAPEKQASATSEAQKEKQKKVLAGVLFVLLGVVFYAQDPLGWFTPEDTAGTVANVGPATPTPRVSPTPRVAGSKEESNRIVDSPLNLQPIFAKFTPLDGISRNIFVYPTPTPPPPPPAIKTPTPGPPPPTPEIVVVGIQPTGVIGRTGDFDMTVTALNFKEGDRAYIEGREAQTTLLDESHIKVKISADAIRNPGNLGVQVRNAGDAKRFSNQLTLNVAEPPRPPFRYVGLIVSRQGKIGVLKPDSDDDPFNVKEGESYGTGKKWRVVSINPQKMELMDNDIKVSHTINFSPDSTTP
jgi:hypothetical protein